jgi:hypothetical protein
MNKLDRCQNYLGSLLSAFAHPINTQDKRKVAASYVSFGIIPFFALIGYGMCGIAKGCRSLYGRASRALSPKTEPAARKASDASAKLLLPNSFSPSSGTKLPESCGKVIEMFNRFLNSTTKDEQLQDLLQKIKDEPIDEEEVSACLKERFLETVKEDLENEGQEFDRASLSELEKWLSDKFNPAFVKTCIVEIKRQQSASSEDNDPFDVPNLNPQEDQKGTTSSRAPMSLGRAFKNEYDLDVRSRRLPSPELSPFGNREEYPNTVSSSSSRSPLPNTSSSPSASSSSSSSSPLGVNQTQPAAGQKKLVTYENFDELIEKTYEERRRVSNEAIKELNELETINWSDLEDALNKDVASFCDDTLEEDVKVFKALSKVFNEFSDYSLKSRVDNSELARKLKHEVNDERILRVIQEFFIEETLKSLDQSNPAAPGKYKEELGGIIPSSLRVLKTPLIKYLKAVFLENKPN